ncbi:MAG: msbA [Rhizobacter sp.]|nr:msbA [Rhizobacter sp.]
MQDVDALAEAPVAGEPTTHATDDAPHRPPETAAPPEPAVAPPKLEGLRRTGTRLARYLAKHRAAVVFGVGSFFVAAALEPLLPALFKLLVDHGFKADFGYPVWLVPIVIVGLFGLRGLLTFAGAYLLASSTSHAVLAIRFDLVTALMRADASLFSHLSPGVAASRVINDPKNSTDSLANALTTLLREGTTLVALLAYLFYLNWGLTIVSLLTVPLLTVVVRRVQRRVLAVGRESYESQVRLIGIVDDMTRAWRVVRTFDAGDFERRRFGAEAERLRTTTLTMATAGASLTPLTQLVSSIGVAVIVTLALLDAQRGGSTVGGFIAFITALLMIISPLRRLTDISQPIIGGLIQARACFELIDTPPEADRGTMEVEGCAGDVRFDGAVVTYPGSAHRALDGATLHLPAGHTIALVGASGAGKTTVVNTMLGFAELAGGQVLLDGLDIRQLRKASLRRQFAVVSQDIVLFDGSIADNVAYAQPLDPRKVRTCLEAAYLWDFVQTLPDGAATQVGTNGNRLSGGQRQRLAIARALYKDAAVWVFDEATSALDSEAERAVQQAIEQWRGRKTLLLIAHRLATVRRADCIHVLSAGRVVEAGSHDDLMARGGAYADMVRWQMFT